MSTNDRVSIWYARLGYLSVDKLKVMVSKNLVNGLSNLLLLIVVIYVKVVNIERQIIYHLTSLFPGIKLVVNIERHIVFHLTSLFPGVELYWNTFIAI